MAEEKEMMEIKCPQCRTKVKVPVPDAAKSEAPASIRCPNGHDVPLVKAF